MLFALTSGASICNCTRKVETCGPQTSYYLEGTTCMTKTKSQGTCESWHCDFHGTSTCTVESVSRLNSTCGSVSTAVTRPTGISTPTPAPIASPTPSTTPTTYQACPTGLFMRGDGTCIDNACGVCPLGTLCITLAGGTTVCKDCNCGFCAAGAADSPPCCQANSLGNNCEVATSAGTCTLENDFFPGFSAPGSTCSGLDIATGGTSCGCKPSSGAPCNYSPGPNKCTVCTFDDLGLNPQCQACTDCLVSKCGPLSDYSTYTTTCRSSCTSACFKA